MTLPVTILAAVAAVATSVHLPVTTSDARAQAAVDRGLFLYYAYDGSDAARSFAQAATFDPRLAIAYWGIALGSGPDLNTPMTADRFERAEQAAERAVTLEAGATPDERRLVAVMARRYHGSFGDWQHNDAAYRDEMLQLARESSDENVRLLAAEALLEGGGLEWSNGTPRNESSRQALALVADVLHDDPANPMANHLCIHVYDLAPDRAPALPCAQRLDATAFSPQAEHLAHMPAHYWIETGNYAAALKSSDRAYALLAALPGGVAGSEHGRHYGKHDVFVGYSAAMMLGNYVVATLWAQRMAAAYDQSFDALTALRFGRYAVAYGAGTGEFGGESARGIAALQLGHTADARAIATRITPADPKLGYLPQLFLARLAAAEGRFDDALRWITQARDNQRADFSGEQIPLFPADEALGDLYLRRGESARAAAAYTGALDAYPNDPRALFGLTKALTAQGDRAQATAARARFEMQWKGADTDAGDALP